MHTTNSKGEKVIWIDVVERREPSQYGATHTITMYNSALNQKVYLADLKPQEFGAAKAAPVAQADDDIPF